MKTFTSLATIGTMLATGGLFMAANAQPATAAGCTLVAQTPKRATATIAHSVGGRSGCTNTVGSVAVAMYHRTWRWDDKMGSASRTNLTNATWTVIGNPQAGWDIYTRTNSSTGAQAESSRLRW